MKTFDMQAEGAILTMSVEIKDDTIGAGESFATEGGWSSDNWNEVEE